MSVALLLSLAACGSSQEQPDAGEENNMGLEDVEDSAIEKGKVTVANMTGADAVSLLARKSGTEEWSDNILSQDYLHTDMAVEVTYNISDNNVYDLKLVFADGSSLEFPDNDFAAAKTTIYLEK